MTNEQIAEELKRIQNKVPVTWRNSVFKEVPKTPTMEFVFKKYIEDGMGTEEQRQKVQALLNTGKFSQKTIVEDPKYAKKIDEMVNREIKKSIKAGKLPKDASKFNYESILKETPNKVN